MDRGPHGRTKHQVLSTKYRVIHQNETIFGVESRGMRQKISAAAAAGLLAAFTLGTTVHGQAGWAKPAFAGQTNAPAPSKPSAPFAVQTITNRLSGPWSIAFLPDGNFLVTEA